MISKLSSCTFGDISPLYRRFIKLVRLDSQHPEARELRTQIVRILKNDPEKVAKLERFERLHTQKA